MLGTQQIEAELKYYLFRIQHNNSSKAIFTRKYIYKFK